MFTIIFLFFIQQKDSGKLKEKKKKPVNKIILYMSEFILFFRF